MLHGINIFRIDGDQITERWGELDHLGLLHQLGLIPVGFQPMARPAEQR